MISLGEKKCKSCNAETPALNDVQIEKLLVEIPDWMVLDNKLRRIFNFKNFYETMAFVNAVAWISHQEDHHPDLKISYKTCDITYSTHAISGLSENDFICAAKVDLLLNEAHVVGR